MRNIDSEEFVRLHLVDWGALYGNWGQETRLVNYGNYSLKAIRITLILQIWLTARVAVCFSGFLLSCHVFVYKETLEHILISCAFNTGVRS